MPKFELGDSVKDTVSGYQGMIVGVTEWLNGCKRYGVQPTKLNKDGKPFDIEWIDEGQLKMVKGGKTSKGPFPPGQDGGPMPAATRSPDPR